MTSLAFMVSTFLSKSESASNVGFLLFILFFVLLMTLNFGFPFGSLGGGTPVFSPREVQFPFAILPPSLLTKGISDIAVNTSDTFSGLRFADVHSYCQAAWD